MPRERYEDAGKRINELKEEITKVITDTNISSDQRRDLRDFLESNLNYWQGVIRGEDPNTTV